MLPMQRKVMLVTAYDGTEFHGWQRQEGVRTVQEVLEKAARRSCQHQVDMVCSGRTDSGVHAAAHVVSFATSATVPATGLRHSIGSRLPKDLAILAALDVHPRFDARKSAISKLYRYRIHNARARPVERMTHRYTYHYWHKLDAGRMQEAARHFVGTHDFSAMAASGCQRETMVRTVLRCDVRRVGSEIQIDVEGTGFLYKQVRNMAGTLIFAGCGHFEPGDIPEILESKQRSRGGDTAPARGLSLRWVRYPPEQLRPLVPVDAADGATADGEIIKPPVPDAWGDG